MRMCGSGRAIRVAGSRPKAAALHEQSQQTLRRRNMPAEHKCSTHVHVSVFSIGVLLARPDAARPHRVWRDSKCAGCVRYYSPDRLPSWIRFETLAAIRIATHRNETGARRACVAPTRSRTLIRDAARERGRIILCTLICRNYFQHLIFVVVFARKKAAS